MVGYLFENAINGIEADLGVALVVISEIDAAIVRSPLRVQDIAVGLSETE
jgi:hypothetical protein